MLGARIAALRRQRNWSQGELAGMLNISASAVGMYEQGRREPGLDTVAEMARIFGVSMEYLVTGVPAEEERRGLEQLLLSRIEAADRRLKGRKDRPFTRQELAALFTALLLEG